MIKNLPKRIDYNQININNKFQNSLLKIALRSLKKGFNNMVYKLKDG